MVDNDGNTHEEYPVTYPDTRQDYYGALLQREAEASVKLDDETVDVGPVTVHEIREVIKEKEADNYSHVETALRNENNELLANNRLLTQDVEFLSQELNRDALYVTRLENLLMDYQEAAFDEQIRNLAQEKPSRIRVFLSRQLTWSEVETLTDDHHVLKARGVDLVKVTVGQSRRTVYVDAWMHSRPLFDVFAKALDAHFVNVHPSAVATLREYNGI